MAIFKGDKEIDLVHYGGKAISAVYYGAKVVWQAIRSCFAAGFWSNDKPWINDEGWKNE